MDTHQLKEEFIEERYDSIMLATTSNHNSDFLRLPDKLINSQKCMSFSVASEDIAKDIITVFDDLAFYIYVDVERKQNIDLYRIVREYSRHSKLREIKPNDLAMDAADILIYKSVKDKEKNIIIVGTGNIGIKLAIRLAERNYNVFLHGRNKEKVDLFVQMINKMLPRYTKRIKVWEEEPIDVLCTMISATEVIDEHYLDFFNEGALAIDGGIGNFKKSFIKRALAEGYNIIRLDVRISNDVLNGIDQSFNSTFFTEIKGERTLNTVHIVSGGIIGQNGDIIVDRIVKPQRVIGAANGIGGVKRKEELTHEDIEKIRLVNEAIKEQK